MNDLSQPVPKHLYLVDGSGYIFRAYHALPPLSRKRDGLPTGAVAGFCNMLNKLIEDALDDQAVDLFAVIFDADRHTFRNQIYADYKANRPPAPEDLVPQFALIREASRAFNLPTIEVPGFEADDVIATYAKLARKAGIAVTIVSSDKDLMQLVGDGIEMLDPIKARRIGRAEVIEKFGVGPERVVDVQALCGDSIDNVPGVPGIGIKTAAQLIQEYGDLDALLARAGEIKQPKRRQNLLDHAEQARISRELVKLRCDVPLPDGVDTLLFKPPDPEVLFGFLEDMEFNRLAIRLRAKLPGNGGDPVPPLWNELPPPVSDAKLTERGYETVQTLEALDRWIARSAEAGLVAVDTETTSLDAVQAELVGVSLSVEAGKACYIPIGHKAPPRQDLLDLEGAGAPASEPPKQLPRDEVLRRLKPLLEDPAVLKVGQNIKYDMTVLARAGIDVAPIDDTMLLSYVLEAGLHGHGMDELAELHLGIKPIAFKEVAGSGRNAVTFDYVPLDRATEYAAEDADVTLRLFQVLKPRLLAERLVTVYETMERPLIPVLAAMELAGIRVDPDELRRLSDDFALRIAELEGEIHRLAGEKFNIGSPKQLGEILFDRMSLGGGRKGKTGAYATGHEVLEQLAAQGHDLPARVLDWRQLSKLKSTYTDALQSQINPETGRVHTCFAMAVASTGRLSSTEPNLQNIPIRTEEGRKIRRAFVPKPGHRLLSADYSQIELRILAHMARIEGLKQAFRDGHDIHAMTASQVFGVPIENMDPMVRRSAKAINFGIIYGISAFGLANNLRIPQKQAQDYIDAYFRRYPGIRDYMEETKAFCRETGYVTTLYGRRCHLPGIKDPNPARRSFQERAAINAPIQGSAADVIKRAMVRIPSALQRAGLAAEMLLQVHDELVFEVPEAEVEETAAVVKRVMEDAAHLSVPLVVDVGVGDNWEEAH